MPDLLIEIGCEEIPARMLDAAREELSTRIENLLGRERLLKAGGTAAPGGNNTVSQSNDGITSFSTPRRLAVLIHAIEARQPDLEEQLKGPATKVAYKDGKPTAAAEAFARKAGVNVSHLRTITNPKGEYIVATVVRKGRSAADLIAAELPKELNALYWPKNMYWRANKLERFVRPVRWIVAMLDGEVLPVEYGGVSAGNKTRGHRILHPGEITISVPGAYVTEMETGKVIPVSAVREQHIRKALDAATRTVPDARWRDDPELLKTVVNLTEFPGVVLGSFDRQFLSLPEEVLVTVMRDHQKYFAVEDATGKISPHFLAVLNTDADRDGVIRHGNERVLRARFSDAQFFWQTDQKIPLTERVEMLRNLTFQRELGSYWSKTERMRTLAAMLATDLQREGMPVSSGSVDEAARLAKSDLTTELVKEFTELQGIIGGLYAEAQGIESLSADAIYDQYLPESADDAVPRSVEGALVSIADKADSIAGMFALGIEPSGSKDPFALRRQANGIVRILAEHKLPMPVSAIIDAALSQYRGSSDLAGKLRQLDHATAALAAFFRERLEFYLRDVLGFAYDVVNAVLAAGSNDIPDAVARARAVAKVRETDDFVAISVAFKRIKNILRQAQERKEYSNASVDSSRLVEPAEQALGQHVLKTFKQVQELLPLKRYEEALTAIARLRPVVDTFFDKVMVMVDDESLRANRLALLATIQLSFSTIADFSEIAASS
jgi:glycyl-tRNA synthetase beta chain